jgi:hypothetical protein
LLSFAVRSWIACALRSFADLTQLGFGLRHSALGLHEACLGFVIVEGDQNVTGLDDLPLLDRHARNRARDLTANGYSIWRLYAAACHDGLDEILNQYFMSDDARPEQPRRCKVSDDDHKQ